MALAEIIDLHQVDERLLAGRFRLGRQIGRGEHGVVHQAFDTSLDEYVALKFPDPTSRARKVLETRRITPEDEIKDEAKISSDPYVSSREYFFDEETETPFLKMELYNTFLDRVLDNKPVKGREERTRMLQLARDITRGLNAFHSKGHVYNDLKPDNIGITSGRRAILADLGLKTQECAGHDDPRDNMGFELTRAPEEFHPASHPSTSGDIFSLGALIYRMLSGEYPSEYEYELQGPEEFARIMRDRSVGLFDRQYTLPGVSGKPKKLLKKMLDFDPDKRPLIWEVEETLSELINAHGLMDTIKHHTAVYGAIASLGLLSVGLLNTCHNIQTTRDPVHQVVNQSFRVESYGFNGRSPTFDVEPLANFFDEVPAAVERVPFMLGEEKIREVTNDPLVAHLIHTMDQSIKSTRAGRYITSYQMSLVPEERPDGLEDPSEYVLGMRNSIVQALEHFDPTRSIDLEDLCTIAMVGHDTFEEARTTAGSDVFGEYALAQNSDGELIIDEDYRHQIVNWMRYIRTHPWNHIPDPGTVMSAKGEEIDISTGSPMYDSRTHPDERPRSEDPRVPIERWLGSGLNQPE